MERTIKILDLAIIVVFVMVLGCESDSVKPEEKKGKNGLSFIDSSHGLPAKGMWRQGLSFSDINGDGHTDILAPAPRKAQKGQKRPFVWYGNGKGAWTEGQLDVPGDITYDYGSIAVSDFDGDGIADIGLAMHGKGLKFLKGKGGNKYEDFSDGLPSADEFRSRALVSTDLDNDGISDIAAVSEGRFGRSSPGPTGIRTCYYEGNRWRCNLAGNEKERFGLFSDQLVVGDVNGDGNKDIAAASPLDWKDLIVWIGDGKGGFTAFNKGLVEKTFYDSVALADINRDGRDDLIASISGPGTKAFMGLKAFLSRPDGFEDISGGLPENEFFRAVGAGDLNNDGGIEIVGGTREGLKIFSRKEGLWHEVIGTGLPEKGLTRIYNIYCVDLNKDGYQDIAVNYASESHGTGGIRVFLNVSRKDYE